MKKAMNPAIKALVAGIFLNMAGYVLVILGEVTFVNRHHPRGIEAYALAILPAIPIVSLLTIVGLYLKREKDEYLRWVTIKALLWATAAVLVTVTVTGFLQTIAGVPALPGYFVFVLFWVVFGVMQGLLHARKVDADE